MHAGRPAPPDGRQVGGGHQQPARPEGPELWLGLRELAPCDHVQRTHPRGPGSPAATCPRPIRTSLPEPRPERGFGSSIIEDHQIETAKSLGVGDQLDSYDFPALDRESEHDARPGAHTSPAAPFTSAGRAARARPEKVPPTAAAPRSAGGRTVTLIASGCPAIVGLARAVRTLTSKGGPHIYRVNH
jgi:hypothetical protein